MNNRTDNFGYRVGGASTDGGSDEGRSVLEFQEGDYQAGGIRSYDGFEFRARLPQKYTHESGDGFSVSEVPEGSYLVSVESGADGVYMEDWKPGDDDRFHLVILYRPRDYKTKQRLTIDADGEVSASKVFYAGDVYQRSIEADTLSFEVGEPRNTESRNTVGGPGRWSR